MDDFNQYWSGNTNKTKVIDLPEAIKNEFISLALSSKENLRIFNKTGFKLRSYQQEAMDNWLIMIVKVCLKWLQELVKHSLLYLVLKNFLMLMINY